MNDLNRIELYDGMADKLYVAVISDILDGLGYRHQVMQSGISPVDPLDRRALVGRAHTVLFAPTYEMKESPYTVQISAIDALHPGDIGVQATSGYTEAAFWGELFSNAALGRGARGMVIDGFHRDSRKLLDLGFPVYSTGARPLDISGRAEAIDYGCPVRCGGVLVNPGDVIFAEIDGIVVIPQDVVDETVQLAFEKVATEDSAREDLKDGALLSDIWKRYRVL